MGRMELACEDPVNKSLRIYIIGVFQGAQKQVYTTNDQTAALSEAVTTNIDCKDIQDCKKIIIDIAETKNALDIEDIDNAVTFVEKMICNTENNQ